MTQCLVVDDSKIVRKVAIRFLEGFGISDILEAEDGQQALDHCQNAMPDVVLLDWNMPVMNGLEFLKAMRALPGGDAPKVVFCTTESELGKIQEAIGSGADEYIMKPFDEDILRTKLVQVNILQG